MIIGDIRLVKAKKKHRCDWCGCSIEVGEQYQYSFNKYAGDVYAWKNHVHCQKIAQALEMWNEYDCDGGVTEDGFQNMIQDTYITIMRDDYTEIYESEDFEYPSFREQLKLVLNTYEIEHTLV